MRYETCAVSGVPISSRDKVVLMFLATQNITSFWDQNFMGVNQFYTPYPIVVKGTYISSGYSSGIYNIESDSVYVSAVVNGIRSMLKPFQHPQTKIERNRNDKEININTIIDSSEHFSLNVSHFEDSKFSRSLTHVYILREVYDHIMSTSPMGNSVVDMMVEDMWNGNYHKNICGVTYEGDHVFEGLKSIFEENALILTPHMYTQYLPFVNEEYNGDAFIDNNPHEVYSKTAVQAICEAYVASKTISHYLTSIRKVWMVPERSYSRNGMHSTTISNHNALVMGLLSSKLKPDPED